MIHMRTLFTLWLFASEAKPYLSRIYHTRLFFGNNIHFTPPLTVI